MEPLTLTLIQSALLILSGTGMACISISMLDSRMKIKKHSKHHFSNIHHLKK
ncbi:MAG: hypothetical protein KAS90_06245 [Candidatus Aenigmarchaeota archaeon]|nr:hypothetical protein [Candidatus Aenigmarchaeota archaeon]